MSFFGSLFSPKEVRDVIYALRSLGDGPLADNFAFLEVSEAATRAVRANSNSVKSQIVLDGMSPLHVALNLIVNLCGRDLGSGNFHTYRGVLGMAGTARKSLFYEAQRLMVERNFIQQEDADFGAAKLKEEIAAAG